MARSTTRALQIDAFARLGNSAPTLIKLMMACNDLSLADDALTTWKEEQTGLRRSRARGARMYYVRLQIAHLIEALKTVEEFRKDAALVRLLERCDAQTQSSFTRLEGFLDGGSRQKEFEQLAGRLRHNLVFHYDESGKLIKKSLKRRIEKFPGSTALVTRGSAPIFWYFELADELLDSIVVRQIWNIPEAANLREAADEAIMRVHEVLLAFVDFAGEVIWKLTEK